MWNTAIINRNYFGPIDHSMNNRTIKHNTQRERQRERERARERNTLAQRGYTQSQEKED